VTFFLLHLLIAAAPQGCAARACRLIIFEMPFRKTANCRENTKEKTNEQLIARHHGKNTGGNVAGKKKKSQKKQQTSPTRKPKAV